MVFELGRRVEGAVLGGVLVAAVLWSDALQYHEVWFAPQRPTRRARADRRGVRMDRDRRYMTEFESLRRTALPAQRWTRSHRAEARRISSDLRTGSGATPERECRPTSTRSGSTMSCGTARLVLSTIGDGSRSPDSSHSPLQGPLLPGLAARRMPRRGSSSTFHSARACSPAAVAPCGEILRLGRIAGGNIGVLATVQRPTAILIYPDGSIGAERSLARTARIRAALPSGATASIRIRSIPSPGSTASGSEGRSCSRMVDVSHRRRESVGHDCGRSDSGRELPRTFGTYSLLRGPQTRRSVRLRRRGPTPGAVAGGRSSPGRRPVRDRGQGTTDRPITYVAPAEGAHALRTRRLDWVEA